MYLGWKLLLANGLLVLVVLWIVDSSYRSLVPALLLVALWTLLQVWLLGRSNEKFVRALGRLDSAELDDPTWKISLPTTVSGGLGIALGDLISHARQRIVGLNREKNRLEVILESISKPILVIDRDSRVVLGNDASVQIFGLKPPLSGLLAVEIIRNSTVLQAIDECLNQDRDCGVEASLTGGAECHIDVQVSPLREGGQCIGAVVILHDITQLRQLERVRRDFVANVSHELRTPLTAIKGYAETLADGALDDRESADRFVGVISSHADRLHRLLDDLLDLADLESEQLDVQLAPCRLKPLVDLSISSVSQRAKQKQVAIDRDIPEFGEVLCDAKLIEQALVNLLDNAVKYTPEGGSVRVGVGAAEKPDRISIFVQDTGIGIPSEDLGRIFERFYRVDKGRSRAMGSTGLGLAIVRHIAEVHGEKVEVQSALGVGTTFRIELRSAS